MSSLAAERTETMNEVALRHAYELALDKIALTRAHWMKSCDDRSDTRGTSRNEREGQFGAMTLAAYALSYSDQTPFSMDAFLKSLDMEKRKPPTGLFASRSKVARFEMAETVRERVEGMMAIIHPGIDLARARAGKEQDPAVLESFRPHFLAIREMAFEMRKPFLAFMDMEGPFRELSQIADDFRRNILEATAAREIEATFTEHEMEHAI